MSLINDLEKLLAIQHLREMLEEVNLALKTSEIAGEHLVLISKADDLLSATECF